jgi:hypothetical protein
MNACSGPSTTITSSSSRSRTYTGRQPRTCHVSGHAHTSAEACPPSVCSFCSVLLRPAMLCCAVLCCAVLCCAVLCCAVLQLCDSGLPDPDMCLIPEVGAGKGEGCPAYCCKGIAPQMTTALPNISKLDYVDSR